MPRFYKTDDGFKMGPDHEAGEAPDIGAWHLTGIELIRETPDQRVVVIQVAKSAERVGASRLVRVLTYYPEANAFRRDGAFGFFVDQGGSQVLLRALLLEWLEYARGRRADGEKRRERPSGTHRDASIQKR